MTSARVEAKIRPNEPIASTGHFVFMLLIQAALTAYGFYLQHRPEGGGSVLPQNRNVLPLYFSIMALEWGWVASVRGAVRNRGLTLWDVVGGRWRSWKDAFIDVAISIPFLAVWEGSAWLMHRILGPDSAKSVGIMLPRGWLEAGLWIAVSVSAGICEEIIFRGYFQKQLAAYTRSAAVAVVLQGILFGVGHSYQGMKQAVIISVLGILYGALAAWRGNLRANMISHAWTDVWNGWLSGVLR
jgi:membrane protease YdiL (CAAX protease family)